MPVSVVLIVAMMLCRFTGARYPEGLVLCALLCLWALVLLLWFFVRRPGTVSAMATWDRALGSGSALVSALCFESREAMTCGERIHVNRALKILPQARGRLAGDLPWPRPFLALAMPMLVIIAAQTDLLKTPLPRDQQALNDDLVERTHRIARDLRDWKRETPDREGMKPEEFESLRRLEEDLEKTFKRLEEAGDDETPRSILEALEARARQAEKLASRLGDDPASELSSDLISEMERHADLADLANALRESNLEAVKDESEKLAERIRSDELTLEQKSRIQQALKQALEAANQRDRRHVVGRGLTEALSGLQNRKRTLAASAFDRIADHFAKGAQRQASQRRLQRLAQRLRRAGSSLSGRRDGGLQRLASNTARSLQGLSGMTPAEMQIPWGAMQSGVQPASQEWAQSGTTILTNAPLANMPGVPVPGMQAPMAGGGQPMPGACASGGAVPVPGASPGGLRAGTGSAPYGNQSTTPVPANQTGVVAARDDNQGDAFVRERAGEFRPEAPARRAEELAIAFLKAEEEALSAEPLPLARRDQVIRYFSALRKQLEN